MAALAARVSRAAGSSAAPGRFAAEKNAEDWAELRYHNLVPSPEDWKAIQAKRPLAATARGHADHGFQLVQHGRAATRIDRHPAERPAPGFSRTGSAT